MNVSRDQHRNEHEINQRDIPKTNARPRETTGAVRQLDREVANAMRLRNSRISPAAETASSDAAGSGATGICFLHDGQKARFGSFTERSSGIL
jgi:hypothetical protein